MRKKGMVPFVQSWIQAMLWLPVLLLACNSQPVKQEYDTPRKGTIHISVDESFMPVIAQQIKVYESAFPDAHIFAEYKSEAECLRDLQQDSTRMVIVTKGLNKQEAAFYESKLSFRPGYDILAFDAVSVVVNTQGTDSVFTLQRLKALLSGKEPAKLQLVVDGNNATSTVRYLLDTLLNSQPFGKNVTAAKGSKAVLDYVAANPGAIGFVGSSWVGNDEDPEQRAYMDKVKLALIECPVGEKGLFARPSQATMQAGQYPLVRPLYYILKENATGLGTGFMNFMSLERGQLIFKRAYLVPAKMFFGVRKVNDQ